MQHLTFYLQIKIQQYFHTLTNEINGHKVKALVLLMVVLLASGSLFQTLGQRGGLKTRESDKGGLG